MKFETKYKITLLKSYLDTGLGVTNYLKYFVVTVLVGRSFKTISAGAVIYAVICFLTGYLYYKYDWAEAQAEVSNRFNMLMRDLRKHIKKKKI